MNNKDYRIDGKIIKSSKLGETMLGKTNHTKNFFIRIIYFIMAYVAYEKLLHTFDYSVTRISYSVIFFIFTSNYLCDNLNFSGMRYKVNNFLSTLFINIVGFSIYGMLAKTPKMLLIGIIYTLIQSSLSYIMIKMVVRRQNVIIYGEEFEELVEKINLYEEYNYIGAVNKNKGSLGPEEDIYKIASKNSCGILILLRNPQDDTIDEIIKLKIQGVKVIKYLEFIEVSEGKIDLLRMNGRWVLNTDGFNILNHPFSQRVKRMYDIGVALLIGILVLPIMIVSGIVVKLTSKGPVIFAQNRVGFLGEKFKIYKFRSMYLHDEKEHSKYAGENDTRITPFGNFMRKTRIDELPQLWNVLKGEMSFVGPRAEWDKLHETYEKEIPYYYLRASVKPGLTGWAQVMYPYGANLDDTKRKLEYDIYYIKYQNFMMDIIIMMKTIKIVLFGKGR